MPGAVVCDGTLGGGGHTKRILEETAPDGRVIGIDRDTNALDAAREALGDLAARVTFVHSTFGRIDEVLDELGITGVDGLLLDIGTSSPQIDHPDRGFSFNKAGPIDMRMDRSSGETALELIRRVTPDELATILWNFGEERYSRRIAPRLSDAARSGDLDTTLDLARIVEQAIPAPAKRKLKIHAATKTFQALRIAVNGELDQLERFLEVFPSILNPGGRCVIISFHSLEDRMVKRRFRDLAATSSLPPDLARKAGERVDPICTKVTRKPIFASDTEVAANPRARSARLRACERFAA
jgi:16S rRNA (cytosine1402-N4)-methyltransferase